MVAMMTAVAALALVPFNAQAIEQEQDRVGPIQCFQIDRSLPSYAVELDETLSKGALTVSTSAQVSLFPLTCQRALGPAFFGPAITCEHPNLYKLILNYKLSLDSDKNPGGVLKGNAELYDATGFVKRLVCHWK